MSFNTILNGKIFKNNIVPKFQYIIIFFLSFYGIFFLIHFYIVVYVRENVKNYVALSEGETENFFN